MARKKSAAKRAREEAEKQAVTDKVNVEDVPVEEAPVKKVKIAEPVSESESESESSEEEDEFGELITENVQKGIDSVLEVIRTNPEKLLDPTVKFFDDPEKDAELKDKLSKDKPIYLKDYHRMNLLSGNYKDEEDNEYGTVDGEKPFVVTEREERNQLLDDIKNAFEDEDEEDDDGFLKKKEPKKQEDKEVTRLPDPEKNSEEFLSAFLDTQAWIPKKNDKVINLDQIDQDDEEDFDNAVENFEKAYNFRFEEANSAEIISYARNQATLRRGNTNSRKRQRDKKNELKEKEKQEIEVELKKKKTQKVNVVLDRLTKIKEAVGDEISDETIHKVFGNSLLDDDFDDADWDSKMAQIFDEQYYGNVDEKPQWDEDDEIMGEFHEEKQENENEEEKESEIEKDENEELEDSEPPQKKSKKDKLKEKKSAKKQKESLREKAQLIVESNATKLLDQVEEERGRSRQDELKFKYRDVSPESFGLSTREIFLADDKDLNKLIGIKKFAPYRPKELVLKDKRKYTKKKHLQDWRREVFRDKNGPKLHDGEKEGEIWIPSEVSKHKTKSHKSKKD